VKNIYHRYKPQTIEHAQQMITDERKDHNF